MKGQFHVRISAQADLIFRPTWYNSYRRTTTGAPAFYSYSEVSQHPRPSSSHMAALRLALSLRSAFIFACFSSSAARDS